MVAQTAEDSLRVVFVREGDYWIAQCLEYDIVAQSNSLNRLPSAFVLAFASHMAVRKALNQKPFEGVPSAPKKYFGIFERALKLHEDAVKVTIPTVLPHHVDARVA